MTKKVQARTRLQFTIEIPSGDVWAADATVGQIQKDASRTAINWFEQLLANATIRTQNMPTTLVMSLEKLKTARLIGEPKVICVLTEEE